MSTTPSAPALDGSPTLAAVTVALVGYLGLAALWWLHHASMLTQLLTRPRAGLYTVGYTHDGHILEAAGADGMTRLWDPDPEHAASWICATAGTPITAAEWQLYIPGVPYRPPCS